ncbi:MAG TPA: hypothetical protein VFE58_08815 [Tepidisphaeraceae bacterium]|nr:hypothetical protein [Tepidisphaeraceae bacterium]
MGLFILWCGFVLWMFLSTVYPHPELDVHRRAGAGATTSSTADR